ncbi:MAG: 3'(2'),5'-bisphosphate nucleotidase CysQ [Xanthobacteraceae bacterium]
MNKLDAAACATLLQPITDIAARAALIVRAASGNGEVRNKADGSPVTAADLAADAAIRAGLAAAAPNLPILSEEQAHRRDAPAAESYFLVDPLDGTREFIAGRDEYTINIALMTGRFPQLGVIAAPALGLIWRGILSRGSERMAFAADGKIMPASPIHTRPLPQRECVVVVSRSHTDARTQAYVDALPQARAMACGSALKFCRIAEGLADLYPRLAPTRDWDVAAGHAIVEAAGGRVLAPDGAALRYGTAGLLIPGFIAAGAPNNTWVKG